MFAVMAACIVTIVLAAGSVVMIVARVTWTMLGNSNAEHQCRCEEGFDMHFWRDKGDRWIVEMVVGKVSIEECIYEKLRSRSALLLINIFPSLSFFS
jgi:hypothetical protein